MTPEIYFKPRGSSFAWVGQGVKQGGSLVLGGESFRKNDCQGVWSSFPPSLYFSPDRIERRLPHQHQLPRLVSRTDTPSLVEWCKMVEDATLKIRQERFQKVVLARQTTLTFDEAIDPQLVLDLLTPLSSETSLYLLQIDPTTALVGASPEKLFSRKERTIWTEAVAGTKQSDEMWSSKEMSEIEAVQLFLQQKLLEVCDKIDCAPPSQKTFGPLQHLYQRFEGVLHPTVTDHDLIAQLHPTPALGGFPQKEALDYIAEVEPFCRGWYGAPFGMISPNESEMAVAIRCAVIRGAEMDLFAGAGIVAQSNPLKEWEELERKIGHFMRLV